MNSKQRCLAAIRGEKPDRTPVFPLLMFMAVDRAGTTYREFASDAQVLAEAQLMIYDRYHVDAITACSDAFRLPADLGGRIVFPESKPPYIEAPLITRPEEIDRLPRPDPRQAGSRMADRLRACEIMAKAAGDECLVLGWVDMPFAEACSACGVTEFMMLLVDDPATAHKLLNRLTDSVIDFSLAQLEAGAEMIGAGDAAASLISPPMYREFALPYEQRVCEAIHNAGGMIKLHICGNTTSLLPDIATLDADLFNVDHLVDFRFACNTFNSVGKCFKGNVDPVVDIMMADAGTCRRRAFNCMHLAEGARYMLSAGCEIPAETPDDVFRAFCEAPASYASKKESK
ncbi:MAG: hypothetical protein HQ592_18530 [Planctomycetes bacterium]|nr:hypothetical protein [Planctomycetota bacterium]